MDTKKRVRITLAVYALLLILGCAAVSYAVGRMVVSQQNTCARETSVSLVKALNLNESEQAQLAVYDKTYKAQRAVLLKEFNQRIARISELLNQQDSYSDEVSAAVNDLHHIHGALQKLSIEHYYEILQILPPEKQAKLRKIAVQSLSQPE